MNVERKRYLIWGHHYERNQQFSIALFARDANISLQLARQLDAHYRAVNKFTPRLKLRGVGGGGSHRVDYGAVAAFIQKCEQERF